MNQLLRFPASLALYILFAVGLSNCGPEVATPPPLTDLDRKINEYEKTANEFVRVARKHKTGDVSITVKLITDEQLIRGIAGNLQKDAANMSPVQTQRVASIAAKTAPFLQ